MDLAQFDTQSVATEGAWVEIYTPRGEKADMRIKVAGEDSELYQRESARMQVILQNRMAEKNKANIRTAFVEGDVTAQRTELIKMLARITLDWEDVEENGVRIAFSESDAIRLYTKYPFLADQVVSFARDRTNFLPQSGKA
jgi:hypothetical protein